MVHDHHTPRQRHPLTPGYTLRGMSGPHDIAAWFDPDFEGAPAGRVHWLALRPSHQGRGLGGALLAAVLDLLTRLHPRSYLVTQSDRHGAIRLDLRLGFTPHLTTPEDRQRWQHATTGSVHPH